MSNIVQRFGAITFRSILPVFFLLLPAQNAWAQLGFFETYWEPKSTEVPEYIHQILSPGLPEVVVTLDLADTLRKISPFVGGYNLNTYYGGKIYDKPDLLKRIKALDLPFTRYPGGSGSNWYFWDHAKPDLPDDVDYMIIKDETVHIADQIKWGDIPGTDYLSLDNSYILRDSCDNEAIHVVNYSYARYGRAEDPVAQAAHYAAEWVRYDNGRTQFWEIGNEIYGSWEPGYIIDTSRNKDGQPLQITGELYAQHCLVFLDSMRAAASDVGADIRIGATLGFQESRIEWDDPVIRILNNQVDFYIVHKYFGNGQDASPDEVFQSIDEFYAHKGHVDGLINKYCETYVPLVITEWNTRYEGSNQNVSCANGMHTMLGMKAIVNEGLGLSCKWNLIWGYKDGNTHGLISGEKDNPSVEGIPSFYPRAPYFYQYYFKKVLGDASIRPSTSATDGVDVFASSFASGHTGAVLVNTTNEDRHIAVNMENYQYGERFYWYLLTPDNGQAFSRKVRVNGQTNSSYAAGGPDSFEEIKPFSARLSGGLWIKLPPFGTAFVLAEGAREVMSKAYEISFQVAGRNGDQVAPLENAAIRINGLIYLTDETGGTTVNVAGGIVEYEILADGHDSEYGSVDVTGQVTVIDTLDYAMYDLNLELIDAGTGLPIQDCTVGITDYYGLTDESGRISFSEIGYGEYVIEVCSRAFNYSIPISIFSDTLIVLQLDSTDYEIDFQVFDTISKDPVNAAIIEWNGEVLYTDLQGSASTSAHYGVYIFSVSKPDFNTFYEEVELKNDTVIEVWLSPAFGDIKFRIYDGAVPVNGVSVTMNDMVKTTNSLGICTFAGLSTEEYYAYEIRREGFDPLEGEIYLRTDTTIRFNYQEITNEMVIRVTDLRKGFVLPSSQVVLDGNFRQTDSGGEARYYLPSGTHELSASSDRYHPVTMEVTFTGDTLYQLPLDLQYAIVQFHVTFGQEVIEDASVTIDQQSLTTNKLGVAVFNDLLVDSTYGYVVEKEDLGSFHGSLEIFHDSTLTVDLSESSLNEDVPFEVRIYPVPVTEVLNIQSEREIGHVELRDLSGRIVYDETGLHTFKHEVSTTELVEGVYILKLGLTSSKIIRNYRIVVTD